MFFVYILQILSIRDSGIDTKGKHIDIVVGGEKMCGFCGRALPIMLKKMGLKSATIYDKKEGKIYYWNPSIEKIEVPKPEGKK